MVLRFYSLSSATFVYYGELNSSFFILVRWVGLDFSGWSGGQVAGKAKIITNSAQLGLGLGLSLAKLYV